MSRSPLLPLWGVDMGGTKIEGVVLRPTDPPTVLTRQRVPTEAARGYDHILLQVKSLIAMLSRVTGLRPATIGFGTPGTLDPVTETLKNSNTVCLNGRPLHRDLATVLAVPVRLANDANCFALAEARWGAAAGLKAETVFGVIMGTGVGGGLVAFGRVVGGHHGIAGEWGHNFLDASGGPCYCGRTGCVETILSGPALERYYAARAATPLPLPEIVARHRAGTDAAATATVRRLTRVFGRAIGPVINTVDPAAIVLGGGVGNVDELYTDGVTAVRRYVFNPTLQTAFLRPALGDSAGVFGAAQLVATG